LTFSFGSPTVRPMEAMIRSHRSIEKPEGFPSGPANENGSESTE
jgi:hypothetical protein